MVNDKIFELRKEIDIVDRELLQKLRSRFMISEEMGKIKAVNNIAVSDAEREVELKSLHKQWSGQLGLDEELVKELFDLIIKKSKNIQTK